MTSKVMTSKVMTSAEAAPVDLKMEKYIVLTEPIYT
jgi:hypothetical protein